MGMENAERIYLQLKQLIETMPDLANIELNPDNQRWLAASYACVKETGEIIEAVTLKNGLDLLMVHAGYGGNSVGSRKSAERVIQTVLYRVLAIVETHIPAGTQGSFIPVGNAFDAITAISRILNMAQSDVMIVDPYMDANTLTDFAVLANEGVNIRLLSDSQSFKPRLEPVYRAWITQHADKRPVELKLTAPKAIHDRLIMIDSQEIWILTQSLNAFAVRSPASVSRYGDNSRMKIDAYEALWQTAEIA